MSLEEINALRAHSVHCAKQANLSQDDKLKKFWSDLADDWIALESIVVGLEFEVAEPHFSGAPQLRVA